MKAKICERIVLVEFDIDLGSTTRIQYPSPIPGVDPQVIADNMLPEGSDKFGVLHTFFTLNRKTSHGVTEDFQKIMQNT